MPQVLVGSRGLAGARERALDLCHGLLGATAVGVVLTAAPALAAPPDRPFLPVPSVPGDSSVHHLSVVVEGGDAAAIADGLALRLPDLEIADTPGVGAMTISIAIRGSVAVVEVRCGDELRTRTIDQPAGDLNQEIASTAANLVIDLLDADSATDDVAPPATGDIPAEAREPPRETSLAPTEPSSGSAKRSRLLEPKPPQLRWDVDVALTPAVAAELGVSGSAVSGYGGLLGFHFLHHEGAILHVGARSIGRSYGWGLGVARLRLAAGGGLTRDVGRWRIGVLMSLTVEPWWPLRGGAVVEVERERRSVRAAPLLGGYARLIAWRTLGPATRGSRWSVGPMLELAGSSTLNGIPELAVAGSAGEFQRLGNLGGVEISVGVSIRRALGERE